MYCRDRLVGRDFYVAITDISDVDILICSPGMPGKYNKKNDPLTELVVARSLADEEFVVNSVSSADGDDT